MTMVNNVIGVINYVIAARPSLLNFMIADTKAIPRDQQGPRDCPRIPRAVRGPDCRPPVNFRAWLALHRGRPAISKRWSQRFGEPLLPPPRPGRSDHPDRVH